MRQIQKMENIHVEDKTNRKGFVEENVLTAFLDSEHIDHLLNKLNRSLWMLIVFFCIPYFVYLFIQIL
ncbi:hypothetical protein [Bacillus sp. FJAT-47783]|uniref:hypothetical protein n=1 Tax=Bacillus sp. FJAT-47783 TaxID=2922712 RepID=UPI001FADFA08|nr:hypothetical protein [Bacillus sp. FJAT-47783]